jgi:nucleotide-binding universal stress UspA family protein
MTDKPTPTDTHQKVLVPLDGSPLGEKILEHLGTLGPLATLEIRLLCVLKESDLDPAHPQHYQATQKALHDLEARIKQRGAKTHTTIVFGEPAAQILAVAKGVDYIAMSTHGRTGVKRMAYGSVAEEVLQGAEVPVLLVNPNTAPSHTKRILVPLDGTSIGDAILPLASKVAHAHKSEVVLFEAVSDADDAAGKIEARADAKDELNHAKRFFGGLRVATKLSGKKAPAEEILGAIKDSGCDLVLLSSHGRSGLAKWLQGSVTEQVVHECRCPVLVKRAITSSADGALHMRHHKKP